MLKLFLLFLWAASFALVAFFAAAETAVIRLNMITARQLLKQGKKNANLLIELLEQKQTLLSSLLVGTNIAMVLSTVLATLLLGDMVLWGLSGSIIAAWGMVILILLYGEIVPKRLASAHAARFALRTARPMAYFHKILSPLARPLLRIPQGLARKIPGKARDSSLDGASLLTLVSMGEEEGALEEGEREMITGVLESNYTPVREIMTPRVQMIAVPLSAPADMVWQILIDSGFSRIPVYGDSIDDIVGLLYAKDVLSYKQNPLQLDISKIMRAAHFVPETKRSHDLLQELKLLHIHMAIVVDEYGGTAGLVTIEDLLEEIVGEIKDEFDADETPPVRQLGQNSWLVDGTTPVHEVGELAEAALPEDEADTIGGLIYWLLDYIPVAGESVELVAQGLKFTVVAMEGHRITQVKISRLN